MSAYELIDNPKSIDKEYITRLLQQGSTVTVQFSDPGYSKQMLSNLNEVCRINDEQLCIRFYGHRLLKFDCKLLHEIADVKNLSLSPDAEIINTEAISKLSSTLSIGNTAKNDINLEHVGNMKHLKSLILSEQCKNIEAIGSAGELDKLTLNKIKNVKLEFLNNLSKLKTLRLLLGSRENISELKENCIEFLEIVWVRGLDDLSGLPVFRNLRKLLLEDLAQLQKISLGESHQTLTTLKISNCKSLNEIDGLAQLKSLNSLFVNGTKIDFDDLLNKGLPASLNNFSFYTGNRKRDAEIKTELQKSGYSVT